MLLRLGVSLIPLEVRRAGSQEEKLVKKEHGPTRTQQEQAGASEERPMSVYHCLNFDDASGLMPSATELYMHLA